MLKKCKTQFCYSDAVCCDGHCAQHTKRIRPVGRNTSGRRRPAHNIPYIAVEIECIASNENIHNILRAQSLRPARDGSLGSFGCEFKICKPVKQAIASAKKLTAHLGSVGAKTNRACGLHVHLDMRSASPDRREKAIEWLMGWQEWFFKLMPPSRRQSIFAERITPYNHREHYTWANLTRYNTIEIRLHGGTLNPHKIEGWMTAMADLANFIRSDKEFPLIDPVSGPSPEQLLEIFPTKIGREYLLARQETDGVLPIVSRVGSNGIEPESEEHT